MKMDIETILTEMTRLINDELGAATEDAALTVQGIMRGQYRYFSAEEMVAMYDEHDLLVAHIQDKIERLCQLVVMNPWIVYCDPIAQFFEQDIFDRIEFVRNEIARARRMSEQNRADIVTSTVRAMLK